MNKNFPEQVFVGTELEATFAAGSPPAITSIDPVNLASGQITFFNPETLLGATNTADLDSWKAIEFAMYNPIRKWRNSATIEKRTVKRWNYKAYSKFNPYSVVIQFGTPNFVPGQALEMAIELRGERDWCPLTLINTYRVQSSTDATEITNIVKQLRQQIYKNTDYQYPYAIQCVNAANQLVADNAVTVTGFAIICNEPLADWSNTVSRNLYNVKVFLAAAFDTNGVAYQGITGYNTVLGTTVTLTPSSFTTATYTYDKPTNSYSGGTFAALGATQGAELGTGSTNLVKSHLWETDLGYQGHQNRVQFQKTPYDPINYSIVYDMFQIEFEDTIGILGESPITKDRTKQLTIYMQTGAESTKLLNILNYLMPSYLK